MWRGPARTHIRLQSDPREHELRFLGQRLRCALSGPGRSGPDFLSHTSRVVLCHMRLLQMRACASVCHVTRCSVGIVTRSGVRSRLADESPYISFDDVWPKLGKVGQNLPISANFGPDRQHVGPTRPKLVECGQNMTTKFARRRPTFGYLRPEARLPDLFRQLCTDSRDLFDNNGACRDRCG